MTAKRPTTKAARFEFLEAWQRHDDAALRMSASSTRPNALTLDRETRRYVEAQQALGAQLSMEGRVVTHLLVACRQLGWERDECLRAVENVAVGRTQS